MTDNPYEPAATGRERARRVTPGLLGAILGGAVWGVALFGSYAFEAYEPMAPEWFVDLDLPDTLGSICAVLAFPIAIGGWLFIWGDTASPFQWLTSGPFNIAVAVFFYCLMGWSLGRLLARIRGRRGKLSGRGA